jgi:hypothetical protein
MRFKSSPCEIARKEDGKMPAMVGYAFMTLAMASSEKERKDGK